MPMSRLRCAVRTGITAAVALCAGAAAAAPHYSAEIRRTTFGIPHIKAADEGSLGFGLGFAYAQDNFCMFAEEMITVVGERSRYFGPDAPGGPVQIGRPSCRESLFQYV